MEKLDYRKAYKELYLPTNKPMIVDVPNICFVKIDGKGDPNGEEFALATAALYRFSYAVKMSYKSFYIPNGYYHYTVFPLEGEWDLIDKTISAKVKSNLKYSIMIRQPDFLTKELFDHFLMVTTKKKPDVYLERIKYVMVHEGLCCQMLHRGSYDNESSSFAEMEKYCGNNRYRRISKKHREIYLSDPRKVESSKLKTVLRFQVEQI